MKDEVKTFLRESGINLTEALERFLGNEALFEQFLKKFVSDPSFQEMVTCMELGDSKKAFKAAHTLKGVAGNLSMDGIYQAVVPIVEALRTGDLTQAQKLFPVLEKNYNIVIQALKMIGA